MSDSGGSSRNGATSDEAGASRDAATSDKWWLPIGVIALLVPIQVVVPLLLPSDPATQRRLFPLFALGWALMLVSPLFLYFDRQYAAAVSGWTPSNRYYLMAIPPIGLVLSLAYLYQRHEHVGVP